MKTRGNPSGPGAITTPHLQRPDIRMQPESCHHAQDAFAQGLGPYTEIPDYTQGRTKRYENAETRMAGFALGIFFLLAAPVGAMAQEAPSVRTAAHANQIWGSVRTEERSTENIFDKNVTILIRTYHENRLGKIVAFGEVKHAHYAVDMGSLPGGKYVVQVDTGG